MKWRYGFYLLIFIGFAIAVYYQYDQRFQSQTIGIEYSLRQGASHINDLVKSSAAAIDTMRFEAESLFRDPRAGRLPGPIRLMLSERPEWGGFALPDVPAGTAPDAIGNLTGNGPPTGRSVEWEREIDVALGLNPLFRAALKEIPNAVWVYYTSGREFINICPWVSDRELHYTADLLQNEFYANGLPDRNPGRQPFWTDAYIDLYGKGMMVTVAAPVDDDQGAFRGTVALDLTLDVLSAFSRSVLNPGGPGTAVLVNASGQLLAHPSLVASSDKAMKMADDILPEPLRGIGTRPPPGGETRLESTGGNLVYWKRLDWAPWTLVYFVGTSVVQGQVLMRMMPEAAVFVFLLLSVFLIERQFRTAEVLRESELKFRHLIEFAPIGVFLSTDYKYIYTNPAGAKIVGLSDPGEIVGKSVTAFHNPKDAPTADQRVGRLLSGEKSEVPRIEFKIFKTDGSERDLDAVSTVVDWGGKRAVLAMVNDITDRKGAERALAESEERFFLALENIPDVIIIYDPDLRISYINAAIRRITGLPPDSFVGRRDEEIWPSTVCQTYLPTFHEAVRSGMARAVEAEIELPGQKPRYLRITCVPMLDSVGTVSKVLGVIQDLTERKAMESQLRHAQKMEVVGQLAGGTAHDFNNLLQVILANIELIGLRKSQDEQVVRMVESAKNAIRRGAKLSQQLLAFSRQQTLRPETIDPNNLIEGTVGLLRHTLGEDIEIITSLAEDCQSITIDPHGLENALLNLALNARAAMPKGGRLTIRSANRHLADEIVTEDETLPAGDYVEIAVIDTGCGMPPEILAHAFEPFFTTKEVGQGSGLGLSMVYGFALQSDGHVTLESEVGKGTAVRMIFPKAGAAIGDQPGTRRETAAEAGSGTILVVEDDPEVRRCVVMVLEAQGYHTREAENGAAALDVLDRQPDVDLLFTDVVMPQGMSGLELAQQAVRRRPDLKVLLTSGYPEKVLEKAGHSGSGFPLLGKPYTNGELSEALRAVLAGG